jgi:UDPglucose--hexose-1-phosphate uridylyltransferase
LDHPARQNLRLLPMKIKNESWYFQYSPYAYYEEHGILIHEKHKPMAITENTFMDMLDFVKQIPHYFIGSNADLPIVGGSILSHAHYQFGLKVLPIMDGKDESVWLHNTYKSVQASIVSWPLSVVRFRSKNEAELIKVCQELFNQWEKYEDLSAEIIPYSNGESHNTLTPVCYMKDGDYTFDIILRNNRTSAIYPHGIFHLHEDVHGIKKENIGLIEAMGLAVLPPRLHKEINIIMQHLDHKEIGNDDLNIIKKHDKLIQSLKTNSLLEIQERIGDIFLKGLHDCGVFKVNLKGREYFKDFMSKLSWKERI